MLKWDEKLSVGVGAIDTQHKELFDKTNDLLDAMSRGAGKTEVLKTLEFLESYVIKHFNEEEALQLNSKYEGYGVQKQEHELFKQTLTDLRKTITDNGLNTIAVVKVQHEMTNWWYNHINKLDTKLGEHINHKS